MRERESAGSTVRRTSLLDSRRSIAEVMEPLVSKTFLPIALTGWGPL